MELDVRYDGSLGIVIGKAIGPITTENIREASQKARVVLKENKCSLLLVDITRCSISRSMLEAFFDMQNFMEVTGLSIKDKTAVLFDPSFYPVERANFIETVVTNRPNPRFKMFADSEKAIAWLVE